MHSNTLFKQIKYIRKVKPFVDILNNVELKEYNSNIEYTLDIILLMRVSKIKKAAHIFYNNIYNNKFSHDLNPKEKATLMYEHFDLNGYEIFICIGYNNQKEQFEYV